MAAELIAQGTSGFMVAVQGDACEPVPLEKVAGRLRTVEPDHPLVKAARRIGAEGRKVA